MAMPCRPKLSRATRTSWHTAAEIPRGIQTSAPRTSWHESVGRPLRYPYLVVQSSNDPSWDAMQRLLPRGSTAPSWEILYLHLQAQANNNSLVAQSARGKKPMLLYTRCSYNIMTCAAIPVWTMVHFIPIAVTRQPYARYSSPTTTPHRGGWAHLPDWIWTAPIRTAHQFHVLPGCPNTLQLPCSCRAGAPIL